LPVLRPWRIPLFWANEGHNISSKLRATRKDFIDFMQLAPCPSALAGAVWATGSFS
jgi:hypothetical protein